MNFLKVLRQRHLAILWSSQVLSAIGDYLYSIAVIWIAVKVAGSAAGIVAAAQAGAALLFGLLGGGFLLMVSIPVLPIALLGSALAATGGPMADIPLLLMIQTDLPSNQIGKVSSLEMMLESGGGMLGLVLAIPLFHYLSPVVGIILCALVIPLPSILGLAHFGFTEPAIELAERKPENQLM